MTRIKDHRRRAIQESRETAIGKALELFQISRKLTNCSTPGLAPSMVSISEVSLDIDPRTTRFKFF